jgi:chromosome segregation ATPase
MTTTTTTEIRTATAEIDAKVRRVEQTSARVTTLRADLERVRAECLAAEQEDQQARAELATSMQAFQQMATALTPPQT